MLRELAGRLDITQTLAPAVITGNGTTDVGTGVSQAGCSSITHIVSVGVSADTLSGSLYHTFKLQESDTFGSGYTDVAVGDQDVYLGDTLVSDPDTADSEDVIIDAAAEDPAIIKFNYKGHKEYSRIVQVKTGNHASGTPISACALRETGLYPAS